MPNPSDADLSVFATQLAFWRSELLRDGGPREPVAHLLSAETRRLEHPDWVDPYLAYARTLFPGERIRVLDLGSGPLSVLGWAHETDQVEVVAVDPQAADWAALLEEAGVRHPVVPQPAALTELGSVLGTASVHVVYARGTFGRLPDPAAVFEAVSGVLRPQGLVLFEGPAHDGARHGYRWWKHDILSESGRLVIRSRDGRTPCDLGRSGLVAFKAYPEDTGPYAAESPPVWLHAGIQKQPTDGIDPVHSFIDSPDSAGQLDVNVLEATFWNRQEQQLEALYSRPHDWRFIPPVAEVVLRPRHRFMSAAIRRALGTGGAMLDIGCGNGWFCHAAAKEGHRCVGVDVSEDKIETARKIAEDLGIADRCTFHATGIEAFAPEEQFDLVAAVGSLHHLPNLVEELPRILERTLQPGGHILFCEPHHEGMVPWFQRFVFWVANWRWYAALDKELWLEASQPEREEGMNLRGESPGGLQFLDDHHASVGDAVREAGVELRKTRSFSYLVGDMANVGIVYMRPRILRGLTRLALPIVTELDWLACRAPRFARWAKERIWFGVWRPG